MQDHSRFGADDAKSKKFTSDAGTLGE